MSIGRKVLKGVKLMFYSNKADIEYFNSIDTPVEKLDYYYKCYFENVKKTIESGMTPRFLSVNKIGILEVTKRNDDKFLDWGVRKLGEDIEKRGTYFPFYVEERFGKLYVVEGSHRVNALKSVGSKRKFLSIVVDYREMRKSFETPIGVYILTPTRTIKNFLSVENKFEGMEKLEENLYYAKVTRKLELFNATVVTACYIGRMAYKNRETFVPNPVITNRSACKKWLGE